MGCEPLGQVFQGAALTGKLITLKPMSRRRRPGLVFQRSTFRGNGSLGRFRLRETQFNIGELLLRTLAHTLVFSQRILHVLKICPCFLSPLRIAEHRQQIQRATRLRLLGCRGGDPYEAIKVIEAWGLNFNLGNALKYIARAGNKDGESREKDLTKAISYLTREKEGRWPWEEDE